MNRILITGATSAIAQQAARHFAADRAAFLLVGRDPDKLAAVADDLRARGAKEVDTVVVDLLDLARCSRLIDEAVERLGGLDALLVAQGTLPDQAACEVDPELTLRELSLNAMGPITLLLRAAAHFETQRSGCLAVITSVAGVRGRRTNYVYGAAKAAVSTVLEGLRGRMGEAGVSVVDIRPGFVETPMTAHLAKKRLFASAATVGERVYRAMVAGDDVVYTPWFWRWIALVIQLIPRSIFAKLSI
ncbi:MAG: SDR family oxidoreductase [Myxococcales bacterium]|nr:SDR family oxidoreductase [Myxococcales bacterium]